MFCESCYAARRQDGKTNEGSTVKETLEHVMSGTSRTPYEAPRLASVGDVHAKTQGQFGCAFGKTIGTPDYWNHIPIANCS